MLDVLSLRILPVFLASRIVFLNPVVNEEWACLFEFRIVVSREVPLKCLSAFKMKIQKTFFSWFSNPVFFRVLLYHRLLPLPRPSLGLYIIRFKLRSDRQSLVLPLWVEVLHKLVEILLGFLLLFILGLLWIVLLYSL